MVHNLELAIGDHEVLITRTVTYVSTNPGSAGLNVNYSTSAPPSKKPFPGCAAHRLSPARPKPHRAGLSRCKRARCDKCHALLSTTIDFPVGSAPQLLVRTSPVRNRGPPPRNCF